MLQLFFAAMLTAFTTRHTAIPLAGARGAAGLTLASNFVDTVRATESGPYTYVLTVDNNTGAAHPGGGLH